MKIELTENLISLLNKSEDLSIVEQINTLLEYSRLENENVSINIIGNDVYAYYVDGSYMTVFTLATYYNLYNSSKPEATPLTYSQY